MYWDSEDEDEDMQSERRVGRRFLVAECTEVGDEEEDEETVRMSDELETSEAPDSKTELISGMAGMDKSSIWTCRGGRLIRAGCLLKGARGRGGGDV